MNNPVQQAILDRRSIRNFRPDALTEAQVEALADAALASPSANDLQPWQFSFVLDPAVHHLLTEATLEAFRAEGNQALVDKITSRHESLFYGAPLVVVISTPSASPSMVDAGIAVQTLALAAQGLGLGSCIIGLVGPAFSGLDSACRRSVGIADDRVFAISVAIGHPAATKGPHERHSDKILWIREAP